MYAVCQNEDDASQGEQPHVAMVTFPKMSSFHLISLQGWSTGRGYAVVHAGHCVCVLRSGSQPRPWTSRIL